MTITRDASDAWWLTTIASATWGTAKVAVSDQGVRQMLEVLHNDHGAGQSPLQAIGRRAAASGGRKLGGFTVLA